MKKRVASKWLGIEGAKMISRFGHGLLDILFGGYASLGTVRFARR